MKKTTLFLSLFALAAGLIGAFAFRDKPLEAAPLANVWYNYNGGPVGSTSSYMQIPGSTPNCAGNAALCAISLPDVSGSQPSSSDLNAPFVQHIQDVVSQHDAQATDVKLKN